MYDYLFTPWKTSTHMDNGEVVVRDSIGRIIANFQCDAGHSSFTDPFRQVDIDMNATLLAKAPQAIALLRDALKAFNAIPNKRISYFKHEVRTTYELASLISKLLNEIDGNTMG